MISKFLFPSKPTSTNSALLILAARIVFGFLFMNHGIQKLCEFSVLAETFPDPIGVGSKASLILAIFGELACSLGFLFGCLYRLALIPMIFTMGVAFFVIHGNDPFAVRELAFVYMIIFLFMFIIGPGKYSLDAFMVNRKKT